MINPLDFAPMKVASTATAMSGEALGGKHDGSLVVVVGFRTAPHVVEAMAIGRQAARKLTDELLATFADMDSERRDEYTALRQLFGKLQDEYRGSDMEEEDGLFDPE